jgi:hypothetical protein
MESKRLKGNRDMGKNSRAADDEWETHQIAQKKTKKGDRLTCRHGIHDSSQNSQLDQQRGGD